MTKLIVIICVLALAAVTMAEDQFVVLRKCDCPDGYAKEYWTTQQWSGYNFIEKKAYTKVDTAKFPYFRCMKWVDFLGAGEKDHGIEADPQCWDDTVWDDGDKITPISPVISNFRHSAFTPSGERITLYHTDPIGIPRHGINVADNRYPDSTQPYGYFMPPLPVTITLPSIDDWVDCWIKKYRGKVCVFNDSGVGWWYEDQDGWHSVWLNIEPLNNYPPAPDTVMRGGKPRVWRSADPEGFCWISGDYVGWATSDSLNQYMHVECRPAHYRVELMKLPDPDTGIPRRPYKVVVK